MKSRSGLSAAVCAALLAGPGMATAADSVFDFYYGADKVAELRTTGNTGNTDFTFRFLTSPDTGAFINDLLLDMGWGDFKNTTASNVTTPIYAFDEKGFEGTGMQTKISFPMPNKGDGRFVVGEAATWTINGAFDGPARVHVNAFIDGKSVKLTTPVPEAGSLAMALVGLGVLGLFGRLRRNRN